MNLALSLELESIGIKARRLLKALCSFTKQYGFSRMRIRTIAEKLKISERHVQRLLKQFQELKWINVTPRVNKSSLIAVADVIIRFFYPTWKSYEQKPVHNTDLSTSYEQEMSPQMSPLPLRKNDQDIQYTSSLINVDECLLEPSANVSGSDEKEIWRSQDNWHILHKYLGKFAYLFDAPSLKRLFALSPAETTDLSHQIAFVKRKNKGVVENPSRLLMSLVTGILNRRQATRIQKTIIPERASKAELKLLQNLEVLEQHRLMADQEADGYKITGDWRYHVIGNSIVFRHLQSDQVLTFHATSKSFRENLNEQWVKIVATRSQNNE
jgi:DNA-binding Lrp family transcriptional regulator